MASPERQYPYRIVAIALGAVAVTALLPVLVGALIVQIRKDIDISASTLGAMISGAFVISFFSSLVAGRVVERIGWQRGIRWALILAGLGLAGAAAFAGSVGTLELCLGVGAMGAGLSHPAANLALARQVPQARRGITFGAKQAAIPFAAVLAGAAVPAVSLTLGWRWAFGMGACLAAGMASMVPRGTRDSAFGSTNVGAVRPMPVTSQGMLILLGCAAAFSGIGGLTLTSFGVTFLVESAIDNGVAGATLAIASVGGVIGRIVAGWWGGNHRGREFQGTIALLGVGVFGFVLVILGQGTFLLIALIIATTGAFSWGGLFTLGVVVRNLRAPARATGIAQAGLFIGSASGPIAFGQIAERLSYDAAFILSAGTAVVGILLISAYERWGPGYEPSAGVEAMLEPTT